MTNVNAEVPGTCAAASRPGCLSRPLIPAGERRTSWVSTQPTRARATATCTGTYVNPEWCRRRAPVDLRLGNNGVARAYRYGRVVLSNCTHADSSHGGDASFAGLPACFQSVGAAPAASAASAAEATSRSRCIQRYDCSNNRLYHLRGSVGVLPHNSHHTQARACARMQRLP